MPPVGNEDAVQAGANDAEGEDEKREKDQAAHHAPAFDALAAEAIGFVVVTLPLERTGGRRRLNGCGAMFGGSDLGVPLGG